MKIVDIMTAVDGSADATSVIYDLGDLETYAISIDFSGSSLGGTLSLQSSNDGTDFITITGSSQVIASAASHMWNVTGTGYRFVRVKWVNSAGTGTIAAKLVAKERVIKGA